MSMFIGDENAILAPLFPERRRFDKRFTRCVVIAQRVCPMLTL